MKKAIAIISILMLLLYGNYQVYAQVLCLKSTCCGCCPADGSGFSPCRCDVGSDSGDEQPLNVSALTVSKVFVRVFFVPVLMNAPVLNRIHSGSPQPMASEQHTNFSYLAISAFQIPLRI
jgi:hypothetical protein